MGKKDYDNNEGSAVSWTIKLRSKDSTERVLESTLDASDRKEAMKLAAEYWGSAYVILAAKRIR